MVVITPEAMAWEAPETKRRRRAPQDPIADVKCAASELVEHIEKMSGAELDVLARAIRRGSASSHRSSSGAPTRKGTNRRGVARMSPRSSSSNRWRGIEHGGIGSQPVGICR